MKVFIASLGDFVGRIKEDLYIKDTFIENGKQAEIESLWSLPELVKVGDTVMIKSIWGYHLEADRFLEVLNDLENKGVSLINKSVFIKWNLYKHLYLKEIQNHIPVIPTFLLDLKNEEGIEEKINNISSQCGSKKLVIKPTVSASGFKTYLYDVGTNDQETISNIKGNKNIQFIVQPYRDLISKGELSVILLMGEVLYGIIRRPGVLLDEMSPEVVLIDKIPNKVIGHVKQINDFFASKFGLLPDICRLDFVEYQDEYEILEIELIDPDLHIKHLDQDLRKKALSAFYSML